MEAATQLRAHFRLDAGWLVARLDDAGYAAGFEAAGLLQWHGLLVGVDAAFETQAVGLISTYTRTAGAATAGISLRPLAYLQLDVLGEIGLANYSGVGSDVLDGGLRPPCPSPAVARACRSCSHRGARVSLGVWGQYDDDLQRLRVTFSGGGPFSGGGTPSIWNYPRTVTVGTQRVALLLGPSVTF